MDGFSGSSKDRTTYGFLDMGGASTQIAFEPSAESQKMTKDLIDVRLRLLGGDEIHHKVFVTTWLGYGTNQARERYIGRAITDYENVQKDDEHHDIHDDDHDSDEHHMIPDPCLPKNLELEETPVHLQNPSTPHLKTKHKMLGTGSFEQCMKKTATLLNTTKPCPDTPCLMNGVHVPPIDFSVSHFIGVSEYWYSSEHIFGLGGAYDFVQYERAASAFCSKDWSDILEQHEKSRSDHHLGGDGEVIKDGKVVDAGQWGSEVEIPRLQMQCFKAAWIANVLHEGIKMPRLMDPGGNDTTHGDKVAAEAEKKGLGRPTFQSMDTVGDIAISWTLGKMVLEASKEVPPLVKSTKPLVDPIDDIEDIEDFPIQPIRPPFLSLGAIEDRISPHLPSSLSRNSLGFSPVLFLFYVFLIFFILTFGYPLLRRIRATCLRTVHNVTRRDVAYSDLMEEGQMYGGRPPSPTSSTPWFRHIFPSKRPAKYKTPLSGVTSNNPILRHIMPGNSRPSPTRSFSLPDGIEPTANSTQYASRSPSPLQGIFSDDGNILGSHSLMTSRSRNASQINLSSMAPRQVAISRSNSLYQGTGKTETE